MQLLLVQVEYESQVAQLIVEIPLRVLSQHGATVAFETTRTPHLQAYRIASCIVVAIRMITYQPIAVKPLHIAAHAQLQLIAYAHQILQWRCLALRIDALLQYGHMATIRARPIGACHQLLCLAGYTLETEWLAKAI